MALSTNQIGICSWSLKPATPAELVSSLREVGLSNVQLALGLLIDQPEVWGDAPQQLADAGIRIESGMMGSKGENYSTLETIRLTGGVILDEHWDENWAKVQQVAKLAASLKIAKVSTHAGFLLDDPADPTYAKLFSRLKQIADLFNQSGIDLLFETGQETADTLNKFLDALEAANTKNVKVNFDPANMILYAKGDPIASLRKLLPRVSQVHIKDATTTKVPGTWGAEVAAGAGEVDWPAFIDILKQANFSGGLIIEREAGETRVADVKQAVAMLHKLIGA